VRQVPGTYRIQKQRVASTETNPETGIIILLRESVERAFSHYLMRVLAGRSFYDLINEQYQRSDNIFGTRYRYVELGLYDEQNKGYCEVFGEHQVLVLMFEALAQRPLATLSRVAECLNLDQEPVRNIAAVGII